MSKKQIEKWLSELTSSETPDITLSGKIKQKEAVSNYKQVKKELEKLLDLKLDDNHLKLALLAGMSASKTIQNPDTFEMEEEPLWSVRKEYLNLTLKFLGKFNTDANELSGILLRPLPITKKKIKE